MAKPEVQTKKGKNPTSCSLPMLSLAVSCKWQGAGNSERLDTWF